MSLSNASFIRSTAILLLLGLAALIGIVALTFWLSMQTEKVAANVSQTRQVQTELIELRSLLQDAETGQRGFLLTRDDSYLIPYEAARTGMSEGLQRLAAMAPAADQPAIARLQTIMREKMAELAQTIELTRTTRPREALAIVRTDKGRALMDDARTAFNDLLRSADTRMETARADQSESIANLQRAVIAGAALIFLVVGSSALIALRYTRELLVARAELASLNLGLEQRVAERTAELARANEELQRFTYIVGHDLRSPLVNVMGFTSELTAMRSQIFGSLTALREKANVTPEKTDIEMEADFVEAIGFIRTSTAKMDSLITAILKLSREGRRPLAPETLDMATLIDGAAANVRHRVQERSGEVTMSGTFPKIVSDRFSLEQVFGNLFDNAVKYADPERAPRITASATQLGDHVRYDIADNGRGIAEADVERVFDLFRRAGKQDQPGEGIGLAAVRAHVRRLGGDITLSSEIGRGSTFHVRLPRVMPDNPAA